MNKGRNMSELSDLKTLMLQAPNEQLDHSMFPLIEKWDDVPKAIQILEVLDNCIYYALASDFAVKALQIMLDYAMENEKTTLEQLEPLAVWRKM
jgi:hypothetical protein